MNQPTRRPTRPTATKAVAVTARPINWPAPRPLLAGLVTIVAAAVMATAWTSEVPVVPAPLLGEWQPSSASEPYQLMAFTPDAVFIGWTENQPPARYPITALQATQRADSVILAVTYEANGAEVELRGTLIDGQQRRLVLSGATGKEWVPRLTGEPVR